jgi:hypothetical protein
VASDKAGDAGHRCWLAKDSNLELATLESAYFSFKTIT